MSLRFYDIFLSFLKFVLRNNDLPQFKHYSLIENYLQFLADFKNSIKFKGFEYEELGYEELLKSIFTTDLEAFRPYINERESRDLIRNFEILIHLYNFLSDRMGQIEAKIIYREIKKFRKELDPLIRHFNIIIKK